ncbi:MAG: hypothetical protein F4069_05350 [Rhodothermaceae bacterium]|nr:hypothetical protein [Rhodothermaceae bacterium]MYJ44739.1 hypothetical protein [Rhodothermaceae bacterium]
MQKNHGCRVEKGLDECHTQGRNIILGRGWRLPVYGPTGLRRTDGGTLIWALIWNVGIGRDHGKGACQAGRTRKALSTKASHNGGSARSSAEGSVMEVERRR